MKPCVCGGENGDCRYCSGSGYVSDLTGLPRHRAVSATRETWVAESETIADRAASSLPQLQPVGSSSIIMA
jgi:hypothetical protein